MYSGPSIGYLGSYATEGGKLRSDFGHMHT